MENYQMETLENRFQEFEILINDQFKNLSISDLNYKQNPTSWSILECFAHLNLYAQYYNPELRRLLIEAKNSSRTDKIKWTWFGKMSVKKIAISNTSKMKTIDRMNPINSELNLEVISNFLELNQELKEMSIKANQVNYNKKGVRVEFLKIVKLNLGETLIFMLEHQNRHVVQAQNVYNQIMLKNSEGIEV